MSKARPHTVKHTNTTGISSPSLPPPDRGRTWPARNVGSGSRPTPSKPPIESSAPRNQDRGYKPPRSR
jgi:hypothetical protein